MNTKTDPPAPVAPLTENPDVSERKPRFAIFIATAGGLGYFPRAPGTLGSLAGIALAVAPVWFVVLSEALYVRGHGDDAGFFLRWKSGNIDPVFALQLVLTIMIAVTGVWSANRAAKFWQIKDPQRVVIDEVSGQHLTLLLGCGVPLWWKPLQAAFAGNDLRHIRPELEIFASRFCAFSSVRYLEARSCSPGRIPPGRLGHYGRRLDCRNLRRNWPVARPRRRLLVPSGFGSRRGTALAVPTPHK